MTYQIEPPACGTSSDCPSNPPLVGGNICIPLGHGLGQQCVTKHASWVASVVAGTNGGDPWGAAFARFYYPNAGNPEYPTNICHPDTLIPAYDWLASANGVTTINESWTCTEAFNYASGAVLEGLVEDWFARNFNVAISKSAGNQEHLGGENPDDPACPYTLNSTCVGGNVLGGGAMSPFSSFTNYNGPNPPPNPSDPCVDGCRTDREEPDISMFAGDGSAGPSDVDVLDIHNATGWDKQAGTSFAAPAAASLTALCKEAAGGMLGERQIRSYLKFSGLARNLRDYNYSTPSTNLQNPDWWDGGGGPLGDWLRPLCDGTAAPGPWVFRSGEDPGDLYGGEDFPFFSGNCEDCDQNDPPLGGQSVAQFPGAHPQSAVPPGPGDNRKYHLVFGPVHLTPPPNRTSPAGRIRAVAVWDSCPGGTLGTAPAPVASDIDLFLVKDDHVVFSSQSVMDVTEGFDITITYALGSGDYSVYWAAEPGPGCGGQGYEPLRWVIGYIPPPP